MELLEAFYRRKLRKKQKKSELGRSDGALCRSPSENNVNSLATGLISKVLRFTSRRSEAASRPHSWHLTKLGEGQQEPGMMELSQAEMSTMATHWHHSCHASAYSSFSTSSSIPEYLASTPSFSAERSYSLETVPQRGGGEMQQADIRYVRTVYDPQQGLSQEHELSSASAAVLRRDELRGAGGSRAGHGSSAGICYHGRSSSSGSSSGGSSGGGVSASNRHSVGPIWGLAAIRTSYESLKGAPAPPQRSDSYAAIRNHERHERPNSWSSLEHARSLRSLHKGSWQHSSGSVASAKGSFGVEGQLHTVMEKSPESSPTTKPRQGGGIVQSGPSPGACCEASVSAHQSGRIMLPTGMYPVSPPEPHYAQMPCSNPGSGSVYPALAKESSRQQQSGGGRDGVLMEGWRDGGVMAAENEFQSNHFSTPYPQLSTSMASTQFRNQTQEAEGPQQEDDSYRLYRAHLQPPGAGAEGQAVIPRPTNQQGPLSQNLQGPSSQTSQWSHNQMVQGHNQDSQDLQTKSTQGYLPTPVQRRDPFTPVQPRGEGSRSVDQPSVHPEPVASARVAQGQVPGAPTPRQPPHTPSPHLQPQSSPQIGELRPPSSLHPHTDSAALQWDNKDREQEKEHPLTRLENALAEVQRCASPDSTVTTSSSYSEGGQVNNGYQVSTRSLSVLEKVNRFEQREQGGKPRSHTTSKAGQHKNLPNERSKSCTDDLRNMLERSTNGNKAHRTMSYRGGSNDHTQHRTPADPSSALQRSRSTFQLSEMKEDDSSSRELPRRGETSMNDTSQEFPWKQDLHEIMGFIQDTSFNRAYRDSLKDAQSKVLRSTSFRRRDLSASSVSPPPPSAPPLAASSSNYHHPTSSHSHQPPPVPAKVHSLEKKGPKTMPKPQGPVPVPAPLSSNLQPVSSPHTPKERHMVSPEVRGPDVPALPSVPPVGPPPSRICGRKRLTMEQKKRSYSEPENMHEVGVSDAETVALFRRGGETSVADRRRMFELAASRNIGGGPPQNNVSRPELRQLQQDALANYVERKRGQTKAEGGQGRAQRPHSAYIQPETNSYTGSSANPDSVSLSSTSSMLSLQDPYPDRSFSPGERRFCSTLPPGADFRSFQSSVFYPGRVTAPRPPPAGHQLPSAPPDCHAEARTPSSRAGPSPVIELERHKLGPHSAQQLPHQEDTRTQRSEGASKQLNGALQRAGLGQGPGKSASAEDLLERLEEREVAAQHSRSHSSSAAEKPSQDLTAGDLRMFGVFTTEAGAGLCCLTGDGPTDTQKTERPASSSSSSNQHHQHSLNPAHSASSPAQGPSQSHPPVTRRERQKAGDRQRDHNSYTLAASVGLPCPFSPPGTLGNINPEWHASERLSQANLDSITFPHMLQTNMGNGVRSSQGAAAPVSGNGVSSGRGSCSASSVNDSNTSGDTLKEIPRERTSGLDTAQASPKTPPPQPNLQPSVLPQQNKGRDECLSSLRISESSLSSSAHQFQPTELQDNTDEVFLPNPTPSSISPPIRETDIMEDFPPPPPSLLYPPVPQEEDGQQYRGSSEYLDTRVVSEGGPSLQSPPSPPSSPLPHPLLNPSSSANTITTITVPVLDTQESEEDSQEFEYTPLPSREPSPEEKRVEALARQLVSLDRSLAPLLDTWSSRSTLEIMEDIFPSTKSQRQGNNLLDDSIQDGVRSPDACVPVRQMETDMDEEEKDLQTRKVALCKALKMSVASLHQEKEALAEEYKRHRALGSSIDALIQDHCKVNEQEKYRMFIGDLEKIVNLLLSLSGRLSRIDRALLTLDSQNKPAEDSTEERDSLRQKRSQLLSQTEDARELKANLDRRQRVVRRILSGYLTAEQLCNYQHFVSIKPSLLICQRHLDDLIRQGEEQLAQLAESLPMDLAEACGWSAGCQLPSSPTPCSFTSLAPGLAPGHVSSVHSTTVTSL
ncbi:protein Shroom3 [Lampris incognitus]|uniref:protein Shroom3 n=1 Tax=Lampris incognitus TaxID=2546036 RepID=UPI0024B56DF8|nr:protein Shroom3 [Lampris incognitus]